MQPLKQNIPQNIMKLSTYYPYLLVLNTWRRFIDLQQGYIIHIFTLFSIKQKIGT